MQVDQNFYNFLVNQAANSEWLEETKQKYQNRLVCNFCNSIDTKVVVSLRLVKTCKSCREFIDVSYADVMHSNKFELADPKMFNAINSKVNYGKT